MYINQKQDRQGNVQFSLNGIWSFEDYKVFDLVKNHIATTKNNAVVIDCNDLKEITTSGLACLLLAKEEAENNSVSLFLSIPSREEKTQASQMFYISNFSSEFMTLN